MTGGPGDVARGFLEARRVALVGASGGGRDRWSYNARMTRALLGSSFDEVVLVSRNDSEIDGHPAIKSIGDDPAGGGDVCVLVVPRAGLVEAVGEAASAGWGRLLVITGQLTDDDRQALRTAVPAVRVWGPNCTGLIAAEHNRCIVASDYRPRLRPGRPRVAVAGQSGGALNAIAFAVEELGCNVSHVLSTGEEIDVGVDDILWYAAESGATDAVVLFVEEARRPERFLAGVRACRDASVPVVVVKVGRSRRAAGAALTHSGALVGDWDDFEAAMAASGGVVCGSLRDGAGVAALSAALGRRPGRRVAFFTSSGGTGALACDVAEAHGLSLAPLSAAGGSRLRELAGGKDVTGNPFDSADGGGTPSTLPAYLETLATEPGVDALVLLHTGDVYGELIADRLVRRGVAHPPLVVVWPAVAATLHDRLLDARVPVVADLADACRWLALGAPPITPPAPPPVTAPVPSAARAGPTAEGDDATALSYGEAMDVLERGDVPVPRWARLTSGDDDGDRSHALGLVDLGPVVVKAARLRGHKARVGGVVAGVRSPGELAEVIDAMTARFGEVVVEEEVGRGVELLVAVRCGRYGGVTVIGLGGVHADVFGRQVVIRRDAPAGEIRDAIAASSIGPLLCASPGGTDGDVDALAALAVRVHQVAAAERLASLEINPLVVTAGKLVACDAKAVREGEE